MQAWRLRHPWPRCHRYHQRDNGVAHANSTGGDNGTNAYVGDNVCNVHHVCKVRQARNVYQVYKCVRGVRRARECNGDARS